MKAFFFTLIVTFFVCSCGFEPVYQQRSDRLDIQDLLLRINIDAPRGRDGDFFKAELEDRFYHASLPEDPRYLLIPTLLVTSRAFIIDPDGISSRFDVTLTSNYQLTRISDGKVLHKGEITRSVSYNVSEDNDYATYISKLDAKKQGISELAEDYQHQLAAILAKAMKAP